MTKKLFFSVCLLLTLLIITGCSQKNEQTVTKNDNQTTTIGDLNFNYSLDYAEGDCQGIADCKKVEYGCGKIICTNQPDNYTTDLITDCSVEIDHPANNDFRCGCVPNEYKCGWIK